MNNNLPKAILFDLDDTILSSGPPPDDVWHDVLSRHAHQIEGTSIAKLFDALAEYRDWYWSDPERHRVGRLDLGAASQHIVRSAFERVGVDAQRLADEIGEAYRLERSLTVSPFPGAIETLQAVRDTGVRTALITNGIGVPQRMKIDDHALEGFFECIVIEGEFGVGKPDHRVYLHAMEQLGVVPEDTWMVGDNLEWEIVSPQKLGIHSIWVDHREEGLPDDTHAHPNRIIRAISELL